MKRYEFRLATVLRLRRAEQERAQAVLVGANATLRANLTRRDRETARYRALQAPSGATNPTEFRRDELRFTLAARTLSAVEREVAAAAASAALAQVAWSAASARVEILERLDARRRAEHAESEQRADLALVDDLVTARYVREGAFGSDGRDR